MKNQEDVIKGIYGFIKYQKGLCEENNTEVVRGQCGWLIPYWECVLSNLRKSIHETSCVLKQRLGPQFYSHKPCPFAMVIFIRNLMWAGHTLLCCVIAHNHRYEWQWIVMNSIWCCYACLGDEEFSKPIWLARAFPKPNVVTTTLVHILVKFNWKISVLVERMWTSSTITLHETPKNSLNGLLIKIFLQFGQTQMKCSLPRSHK